MDKTLIAKVIELEADYSFINLVIIEEPKSSVLWVGLATTWKGRRWLEWTGGAIRIGLHFLSFFELKRSTAEE